MIKMILRSPNEEVAAEVQVAQKKRYIKTQLVC